MKLLMLKVCISYLVASLGIIIMVLAPLFYVATGSIFPLEAFSSGPVVSAPVCSTRSSKPPFQLSPNELDPNDASGVDPAPFQGENK